MSVAVSVPRVCTFCGYGPFASNHWYWSADVRMSAGGSWKCRQRKRSHGRDWRAKLTPVRREEVREYARQYSKTHDRWTRYKAYRSIDNRRYSGGSITWAEADVLMSSPCYYCELAVSEGLDRRDSSLGHTFENVVSCCVACNHILGDVSADIKDLLADGLRAARLKGLLETWTPPQLRKK